MPQIEVRKGENPHPEGLNPMQEGLIRGLYSLGAIRFGDSLWALHRKNPDAPLSPIFTDFRAVQRDLLIKGYALRSYSDLVQKAGKFDFLAGLPIGATPLTSSLSDLIEVPMVTPRTDDKKSGKVDGLLSQDKGKIALMVDDVVSLADTKMAGKRVLEENGLKVEEIIVLMNYEIGGEGLLAREGIRVHASFTANQMIDLLVRDGRVSEQQGEETKERLNKLAEYLASQNSF